MTKAETTDERLGGYRVLGRLATGGTSDVLLARAEGPHGFERTVVLKLLHSQSRNDADMFAREASAYARLAHPAIVRLFDFFALPTSPAQGGVPGGRDGQLVMVLEHIDGPALSRLRTMLRAVGHELDDFAAVHVAARVFDALAAAHAATDETGQSAPVIHRDVNPSNVLLSWDGHVKLADFGVAKVTGSNHQSVAGMIRGTYGYMAPEQVTGALVRPRADVYAAGIVLWELLTRRRAFQRGALPEMEALRAMAEPRLPSIDVLRPEVEPSVRDALLRALEPHADRRTITAAEMVDVLTTVVSPALGEERLRAALARVRNDPRANAATSAPPAQLSGSMDVRPRGEATQQRGRPPPVPSTRRALPAVAAPTVPRAESRAALPAVAAPTVPRAASRATMPVVRAPNDPTAGEPPSRPSASARLAQAVPDRSPLRLGTPLEAMTAGLSLKDAIDEILRGQPSSMPPSLLRDTKSFRAVTPPDGSRATGDLPAAAPPLLVSVAVDPPAPPPAFGDTVRELVDRAEAPTLAPPPSQSAPLTPRMAPIDARSHTLAMPGRPSESAPPAEAIPLLFTPPPPPPPRAQSSAPRDAPAPISTIPEQAARRPRRSAASWGAVAATLLVAVVAGAVGVVALVRHQDAADPAGARSSNTTSAPRASGPESPIAAPAAGLPTASDAAIAQGEGADAVALPVVSTTSTTAVIAALDAGTSATSALDAGTSVTSAWDASASATSALDASVSPAPVVAAPPIAEGVGLIKTTGSTPGRRIFVGDKTLGQTPETVTVTCGPHSVRIGSAGKVQRVDVPCGGEILVVDKF